MYIHQEDETPIFETPYLEHMRVMGMMTNRVITEFHLPIGKYLSQNYEKFGLPGESLLTKVAFGEISLIVAMIQMWGMPLVGEPPSRPSDDVISILEVENMVPDEVLHYFRTL